MIEYPKTYLVEAQKIYTFDSENTVGVAILIDDGQVKELFTTSPPLELPKLKFSSNFVVPGFIDSHTHILLTGLQMIFPDLSGVQSITEILDLINTYRKLAQDLGFLICYNFEPEKIKENRYIHKDELDHAISQEPVIVLRSDVHSASVNSCALNMLSQTEKFNSTINPSAYQTGILKGRDFELAYKTFFLKIPHDLKLQAFRIALNAATSVGITTLVTMLGSDEDSTSCELLLENLGNFPIEVVLFYQTRDIKRVTELGLKRIGGCILIDGSFGSHTAAIFGNYNDRPETNGALYFLDQELEEFFQAAETHGLQTAVHAIGDRAIDQVLRVWEKLLKANELRHRIEHCELVNETLITRIKNLGLVVSGQPTFEHYWGGPNGLYAKRLGSRWRLTNPFATFIKDGIMVLGGSDAPITPLNPLLGIKSAVFHPNYEARISLLEAYKLFTVNGAWGIFAEDRLGQLKPNYEANFVVLEKDPLVFAENTIKAVFYRGKKLYPKN
ncbi:MAG: amidohydrolase [candidate division WOR-3 bacterium]